MRRIRNTTPYLLSAKYAGKCSGSRCQKAIRAGEEIMYYPSTRSVVCRACATPTLEALADEAMMSSWGEGN